MGWLLTPPPSAMVGSAAYIFADTSVLRQACESSRRCFLDLETEAVVHLFLAPLEARFACCISKMLVLPDDALLPVCLVAMLADLVLALYSCLLQEMTY